KELFRSLAVTFGQRRPKLLNYGRNFFGVVRCKRYYAGPTQYFWCTEHNQNCNDQTLECVQRRKQPYTPTLVDCRSRCPQSLLTHHISQQLVDNWTVGAVP